MQSFEKAGIKNPDGTPLKEGDDLPIAYTVEETNSIKEITGMLYGYYNHEERTSFQTGTYSQLFMAFKTYIVGELKYYFGLPNGKTSVGKVGHITDGIPTKEHPNGSPLYIQKDGATGLEIYTTEAFDKNGNPNISAALRAAEIDADIILLAKNVDAVYDSDPNVNKDAKKLDTLTYIDVLNRGLGVMDSTATSLCMDNHIPIRVFGVNNPDNIRRVIMGETLGTIVE